MNELVTVKGMLQDKYEGILSIAYRSSAGRFKTTWTSSIERAALKLIDKGDVVL